MDFLRRIRTMKIENERLKELSLNGLIVEAHSKNLKVLKKRIDKNNVNSTIIIEKLIPCTPLEYSIKVANDVSLDYFISIGGDLNSIDNLSELCKGVSNIKVIRTLMQNGVDFNQFSYPITESYDYTEALTYRLDEREGEEVVGFYGSLLLSPKVKDRDQLLKNLEQLGIKPREDDYYSPLELGVMGDNSFSTLRRLKENSNEKVEEIFSLIIESGLLESKPEYFKLFVDEFKVDLTSDTVESSSLIDEICYKHEMDKRLIFEAFKRIDSYDGLEELIYSSLDQEQIAMLEGLSVPAAKRIFLITDYKRISQCLNELESFDRKHLNHIVFTDGLDFDDKLALVDEYIRLGGDINVLFDQNDINPNMHNANILYYVVLKLKASLTKYKLISALVERGAKIEQNGLNALVLAIDKCMLTVIKLLLGAGANPNCKNRAGDNSLIDALYLNRFCNFTDEVRIIIIDMLLGAGLDLDQMITHEGEEITLLDKLWILDKEERVVAHLFHRGVGDFTRGNIPHEILISTSIFNTEAKKKIIDLIPSYEFERSFEGVRVTFDIYNILFNYKLDGRERDELINHLMDKHPYIKAKNLQVGPAMSYLFREIKFETFVKVIKHNSHLVDNVFIEGKGTQSIPFIYSFVLTDKFAEALQSKQGIEEIKTIIKLLVDLGADINKPLKYLDRLNSETHSDSSSILKEVYNQMVKNNKFCPEVVECLLDNGLEFQAPQGSLSETPIMGFHRILDYHTLTRQEMIIEIFKLLDDREEINLQLRNKFNSNLLLAYSKSGFYKIVEWLLKKGARVDVIGGFDNSPPLHKAISNYNNVLAKPRALTVEVLLKYGANIEEFCNADHFTPLMSAAYYGAKQCVKVLVEAGANTNAVSPEGKTPAICAVMGNASYDFKEFLESNQSDILRLLSEHGANLDYPSLDDTGLLDEILPPLHLSIYNGKKEIFETLISLGANIDIKENRAGMTPLMYAVEYGDMYFTKRLNGLGADYNMRTKSNENVLTYCLYRDNEAEGKKLYNYFKSLGVKVTESKPTADLSLNLLHTASSIARVGWVEELSKEFNVNLQDTSGNTPLIWVVASNYKLDPITRELSLKKLISFGANVNKADKLGRTPLLWAMMLNYTNLSKILIESGASIPQAIIVGEELGVDNKIIEKLKQYISNDGFYN